jgi:hypothetical protein
MLARTLLVLCMLAFCFDPKNRQTRNPTHMSLPATWWSSFTPLMVNGLPQGYDGLVKNTACSLEDMRGVLLTSSLWLGFAATQEPVGGQNKGHFS